MKQVLTLAFILISVGVNAQYSKSYRSSEIAQSEIIIPTSTLLTTFAINEYRIQNQIGTRQQTAMIAATGILTTVVLYFGIKYIKKKRLFKRK